MRNLVALLLCCTSVALAGDAYLVQALQIPSGFTGVNFAGINNSGQAAGFGQNGAIASQVFISSPAGSFVVPLPSGWTAAKATAINNAGQVTGFGGIGVYSQAFIGSASGSVPIPLPPNWLTSEGNGINDLGQVVGTVHASSTDAAFIGTADGSTVLPISGWSNVFGQAINNSGQVTGSVRNESTQDYSLPFIYGPSTGTTVFPPVPDFCCDGFSGSGQAINAFGQIAGTVTGALCRSCPSEGFVGTMSSGITLIPLASAFKVGNLPVPTIAWAGPQSINDSGVVVGNATFSGWIWDAANGLRLLGRLVPRGWNIAAVSISDSGLILATASFKGGDYQHVELVPVKPVTRRPRICSSLHNRQCLD